MRQCSERVAAVFYDLYTMLRVSLCLQANLYAEVLNFAVSPLGGTTAYGTNRTFSATVVAVGTGSNSFAGQITFVDSHDTALCTTTVQNNNTLLGTTVIWLHGPSAAPPSYLADASLLGAAQLQQRWHQTGPDPVKSMYLALKGILGWRMFGLRRNHTHIVVHSQVRLQACA